MNIFETLSLYGFHDTEIFSIEDTNMMFLLRFKNGIFLLDDKGKETTLTGSTIVQLHVVPPPYINSIEQLIEINEYDDKIKTIEYLAFKNLLCDAPFEVSMVYFSPFDNTVLFQGSIGENHMIDFTITNITKISIEEESPKNQLPNL